jgi:hypothetical protein
MAPFFQFFFLSPFIPAVYDGLTARISKCVAFAGRAKCAGVRRGKEPQATDLSEWRPPCVNRPVMRSKGIYSKKFIK